MQITPIEGVQIYAKSDQDRFYEMPPLAEDGFTQTAKRLKHYPFDRTSLVRILKEYNHSIGNDCHPESLLDSSTFAFVTGQQPGFMGGPSYTVLKAITCLIMAKQYGVPAIFWIASDDHDLDEAGKTFTIDDKGNLKRWKVVTPNRGCTLDSLMIDKKGAEEIEAFTRALGLSFSLPAERSYSHTMAAFLAQCFKGTGLIFIEPKFLSPLVTPFFKREIEHADAILDLFNAEPLKDLPFPGFEETTLFMVSKEGKRERVCKNRAGFTIKDRPMSQEALLTERLTSSVMSRPVLASSMIPTAGTILGPGELNYFRGLKQYFRFHDLVMPWIVPRISATVIPRDDARLMSELDMVSVIKSDRARALIKTSGITGMLINRLENLLCPHGKLQERILNWFTFQSQSSTNIIKALLESANPYDLRHQIVRPEGD